MLCKQTKITRAEHKDLSSLPTRAIMTLLTASVVKRTKDIDYKQKDYIQRCMTEREFNYYGAKLCLKVTLLYLEG